MARVRKKHQAQYNKLFEHTKVKPFPKWNNALQAHRQIQKMTDKQFQLYSAIIDHTRGKADIKKFYPMADMKLVDEMKGENPEAMDSLARNLGSKNQLSRWHRKVWSNATSKSKFQVNMVTKGGEKAGGIGSAMVSGAKAIGKGALKVGKYLAKHGASLAKKAWNTAKKVGTQMKKLGVAAGKWFMDPGNQSRVAQFIELVKQGAQVVDLIANMGAAGPIPAADLETVSVEKKNKVDALMDDSDYASSGDDSADEGGKTVGEMGD